MPARLTGGKLAPHADRVAEFLIAGVQKAGTTALHRLLSQHPSIVMPARKELHFFDDDDGVDWSCPDYARYHGSFPQRRNGQIAGEATPIYTYWPAALERIAAYHPRIKILVSLRQPVARAYSHWKMEVTRGDEIEPFSRAIREGRERVAGSADSRAGCHRIFSYVERGFYAQQIERLLTLFPRSQLMFLTSEDLRRDARGTSNRICDFLGIGRFEAPPVNQWISPYEKTLEFAPMAAFDGEYLHRLFADDIRLTAELTGLTLSSWIEDWQEHAAPSAEPVTQASSGQVSSFLQR